MAEPTGRRFVAGLLSLALPGLGQLYVGARRRGLVLLGITAAGLLLLLAASSVDWVWGIDRKLVALLLALDLLLLAFRLFAVADAARGTWAIGFTALLALTALPHVAAGWVTVRGYDVLENVFADEEPCGTACDRGAVLLSQVVVPLPEWVPKDAWEWALVERLGPGEVAPLERSVRVLADAKPRDEKPWTTILLLGTDEGPGNWGARTDTIILAAIQHGTGRATAFGVPRNLAQVPHGPKRTPFKQPLNALYGAKGGGEAGAAALKDAVSNLLGMRVDYYALVNLVGFADLVDALGGVEIEVKERLVDEVTRPAWGEPKPRIDVVPGRTYRFYGREALAYVRSRKTSSDYTRMARQRCFLSALADQLDPVQALRNFGSLAKTVETNVHTDIPLNRLPPLIRLASGVDPKQTLTVTFGLDYFFARRPKDRAPVPNLARIQRTVRAAIRSPELLRRNGKAKTARETC
jgi:LCP family protein required for cell wall assembly